MPAALNVGGVSLKLVLSHPHAVLQHQWGLRAMIPVLFSASHQSSAVPLEASTAVQLYEDSWTKLFMSLFPARI
eukprot:10673672-Karenia_brevis.AAC.1